MTSRTTTTEIQVVQDFLDALERFDLDGALALLAPEVTYQNVPFPPASGYDAVAEQLRGLVRLCSGFEVRMHHIASDGAIVLTERTDVLGVGPVRAAFWVCGTFEVHDGLITLWRDRFDYADLTWAFLRGAGRALLRR
jgi:limonene-1,2-epoxide hydrolase